MNMHEMNLTNELVAEQVINGPVTLNNKCNAPYFVPFVQQ